MISSAGVPAPKTAVSVPLHTGPSTQAVRILNGGRSSLGLQPPTKIATGDQNKEGGNRCLLDVLIPAMGTDWVSRRTSSETPAWEALGQWAGGELCNSIAARSPAA